MQENRGGYWLLRPCCPGCRQSFLLTRHWKNLLPFFCYPIILVGLANDLLIKTVKKSERIMIAKR